MLLVCLRVFGNIIRWQRLTTSDVERAKSDSDLLNFLSVENVKLDDRSGTMLAVLPSPLVHARAHFALKLFLSCEKEDTILKLASMGFRY